VHVLVCRLSDLVKCMVQIQDKMLHQVIIIISFNEELITYVYILPSLNLSDTSSDIHITTTSVTLHLQAMFNKLLKA